MEIQGGSGSSGRSAAYPPKYLPGHRRNARDSASQSDATAAQQDANDRIAQAQQAVANAQAQSEQEIDQIRQQGDSQQETESAREDAAIDTEKEKGYERIRALRQSQAAEISQIHRDGERDRQGLQDYYKLALSRTMHDGDEKVRDTEQQKRQEFEYANRNGDAQVEDIKAEHANALQRLHDHQEEQMRELAEQDRVEYEKLLDNSHDSSMRSQKHFQEAYQHQVKDQNATLGRLYGNASQKIREVRQDTSQKLAAYSSRQDDPFYKMMDIGAKLSDHGDHYELRARIPEHEQEHVSAIVRGDQIVVQGYRRNQEKLDLAPGRGKSSSSYESFEETFPLTFPVDARHMTRQFDGDTMIVRVPKSNEYAYKPYQPTLPQRVRAERPIFPENIPHTKNEYPDAPGAKDAKAETEKPSLSEGSLESRTLS